MPRKTEQAVASEEKFEKKMIYSIYIILKCHPLMPFRKVRTRLYEFRYMGNTRYSNLFPKDARRVQ